LVDRQATWDKVCASFETPALQASEDEAFLLTPSSEGSTRLPEAARVAELQRLVEELIVSASLCGMSAALKSSLGVADRFESWPSVRAMSAASSDKLSDAGHLQQQIHRIRAYPLC